MRRQICIAVAAFMVGLCCFAQPAFAFGTLSHCIIAEQAGSSINIGYHLAPDFWESKHIGWENTGVADEFCWTHEVRRTRTGALRKLLEPTYYTVSAQRLDNSASEHMKVLINSKLKTTPVTQSMRDVIKGWEVHNKEDQSGPGAQRAHFDLFPAPDTAASVPIDWPRHAIFEKYCDVLLYVDVFYGGDPDAAFSGLLGTPVGFPAWSEIPYALTGTTNSDGLLCLAMKVFRKKQETIDTVELDTLTPVDRTDVTATRFAQAQSKIPDLLTFNIDIYYLAKDWATSNGNLYWSYYTAAVAAATGY